LFVFSLFLGPYLFAGLGTRIADFVVVILILSYLAKGALRGEFSLLKTPLDKAILLFLGVLTISLINAVDLGIGIKNLSRHVQLFALFYVVQSEVIGDEVRKLVGFFLALTIANSVYNLSLFILHAGRIRSFGFAGVPFADMLVASIIICYSFYLFQESKRNRLKYAVAFFILLGALFATQTRGAMLSFFLSYVFVSIVALRKKAILDTAYVRHGFWKLTLSMVILILLAFILFEPLMSSLSHRAYSLYQLPTRGPQETIEIRLLLWLTALKAFASQPLLGIGIGQFKVVHLAVPSLIFSPLFRHTAGLGTHNIILTYLSQAGLLGFFCLLYLMFSSLKVGWRTYRVSSTKEDLSLSISLLGILFFVVASSFYAGAWFYSLSGMEFMFFLALMVSLNRILIPARKIEDSSEIAV
jgi:O-antigen ligase